MKIKSSKMCVQLILFLFAVVVCCWFAQFDQYREAHTVDDVTYHHDMDRWEMDIATQKKVVVDLNGQLDVLEKVFLKNSRGKARMKKRSYSRLTLFVKGVSDQGFQPTFADFTIFLLIIAMIIFRGWVPYMEVFVFCVDRTRLDV